MTTEHVKTMAEMNQANLRFRNRVKTAQENTLIRLGTLNIKKSQEVLQSVKPRGWWHGKLFNSINLKQVDQFQVKTFVTDYGTGDEKSAETEYGLKSKEYRKYVDNPLLKQWAIDKLGFAPGKGLNVHPLPVGYWKAGYDYAKVNADKIIIEELQKIV